MTTTTTTAKTFTHNGYNSGRRPGASFRIGYTEYRVWTLDGFYLDALREFAEQVTANVARVEADLAAGKTTGMPNYALSLPEYHQTRDRFVAEQTKRGSALRGASPQGAMMTSDRADNQRRADAFRALPEVVWGDVVIIDGVRYTVTRDNNDHARFVAVPA